MVPYSSTPVTNSTKPTAGDTARAAPVGNDILTAIINQLLAGGTPQMQADKATKNAEISAAQNNRSGYSKEAAFGDAQGLMAQTMRQALEKLMPSINSASLGAGSSASSMRALLVQKAAENAGQAASAQGLETAVRYGGVSNQFTDAISRLLNIQDPSVSLAIQAATGLRTNTNNGSGGGGNGGTSPSNSTAYEPYPLRPATNQGPENLPINKPGGMGYYGPATPDNAFPVDSNNKPIYYEQAQLEQMLGSPRFSGIKF